MTTRWRTGAVVGTFDPPHLGHAHLLQTGATSVELLHVVVVDRVRPTAPLADRVAWLAATAPGNVRFHPTPDDLPAADEPWARRVLEVLPTPPDVGVSAAPWGPAWASLMGAVHLGVDPQRVPVRTTAVRRAPRRLFHLLVPAARAALAQHVAVVGGPRTGRTTIARALARTLRTTWVPDQSQAVAEAVAHLPADDTRPDAAALAARMRAGLLADLAVAARSGIVLVDGAPADAAVGDVAVDAPVPALHLLCSPDFPDPAARGAGGPGVGARRTRHDALVGHLHARGVPNVALTGPHLQRMVQALAAIDRLPPLLPG